MISSTVGGITLNKGLEKKGFHELCVGGEHHIKGGMDLLNVFLQLIEHVFRGLTQKKSALDPKQKIH